MAGTSSNSANAASSNLPRHQACSNCRYRKIVDDATHAGLFVASVCTVEILEEDIRRVQSRIQQLENPPTAGSSSVQLHHPYREAQDPAQIPGLHQILETPQLISAPLRSGAPIETSTSAPDPSWNFDEPPMDMREGLLDVFLVHAADWGFFLDVARFRREALLPLPLGHHSRPCPALLATVYLAAVSLSDTTYEKTFLERALTSLSPSLSGLHPRKTLHVLQAELLLATYFFSACKFSQGTYHMAAALSLAVGSGLRTIPPVEAQAPVDPVAEGEGADACCAAFALDRAWAAALSVQSNWSRIPCTLEPEYPSHLLSPKALLAKAALLWERADRLAVSWKPDMNLQESHEFSIAFDALDERVEEFRHAAVLQSVPSPGTRTIGVAYNIAHAAAIRLNAPLAYVSAPSKQKHVDAAMAILHALANSSYSQGGYINPIMAAVWGAAFRVAIDEIRSHDGERDKLQLAAMLERAFAAMRAFAGSFPLMDFHIEEIQEAYSSAQ
ncbi:hypothetical protein FB451DRAFT_1388501 [Mycena latifolia]|nr:hypothetical protein FB451DRAFT_1388501 [Mycena latifolia]